ncbi:MAG: HEN1 C-terminal domain; double-stranded RNA 3'-methylase, partial [uncultured Solirubrobacteraceae bacterium]
DGPLHGGAPARHRRPEPDQRARLAPVRLRQRPAVRRLVLHVRRAGEGVRVGAGREERRPCRAGGQRPAPGSRPGCRPQQRRRRVGRAPLRPTGVGRRRHGAPGRRAVPRVGHGEVRDRAAQGTRPPAVPPGAPVRAPASPRQRQALLDRPRRAGQAAASRRRLAVGTSGEGTDRQPVLALPEAAGDGGAGPPRGRGHRRAGGSRRPRADRRARGTGAPGRRADRDGGLSPQECRLRTRPRRRMRCRLAGEGPARGSVFHRSRGDGRLGRRAGGGGSTAAPRPHAAAPARTAVAVPGLAHVSRRPPPRLGRADLRRGHRAPGPPSPRGVRPGGVRPRQGTNRRDDDSQPRVQRPLRVPRARDAAPPRPSLRMDTRGVCGVGGSRRRALRLLGALPPRRSRGPRGRAADADGRLHLGGAVM